VGRGLPARGGGLRVCNSPQSAQKRPHQPIAPGGRPSSAPVSEFKIKSGFGARVERGPHSVQKRGLPFFEGETRPPLNGCKKGGSENTVGRAAPACVLCVWKWGERCNRPKKRRWYFTNGGRTVIWCFPTNLQTTSGGEERVPKPGRSDQVQNGDLPSPSAKDPGTRGSLCGESWEIYHAR